MTDLAGNFLRLIFSLPADICAGHDQTVQALDIIQENSLARFTRRRNQ
ncbi:hypothetical protein SJ05684_c23310 [Sinorhizobium sojae CCBAU 05684]|uniref:Uncharacterized protein n=1 Tax=Sinorhizobium sojae CCBAU 05684 TaxID=716928 RepID=A0A249PDE8_9HYPH|nr:hypothetical protein SJ05684_c23310 [Sinorhizobium sojae CCBAU 05684]